MKYVYAARTFNSAGRQVVETAEAICADYARRGYELTLRQLYYQFIARDAFPESRRDPVSGTKNTERNYKWLGSLVGDARLAGLIDWNHLTDLTREVKGGDGGYGSPEQAIASIASWYSISHWNGQPNYAEVWVEKEALLDVIGRPAGDLNVARFACKGYSSLSAMHEAARRLKRQRDRGRKVHILYLGDHDPSGIDMSRDVQQRLATFLVPVTLHRLALNMDQVLELNPPPSPAKVTDSRAAGYIEEYGEDSWELDAIDPAELDRLVRDAIEGLLDRELYDQRLAQEEAERSTLTAISDNYGEVLSHLRELGELPDEES